MTVLPSNIFDFWKEKSEEYSALFKVANHALYVPASSAPVERIFSAGGLIMRPHTSRLSCNMLEMLVYLKCNFGFLEKQKLMSQIKLNFFTKNILVSISVSTWVLVSKKFYSLGLGLGSCGLDYITGTNC